MTNLYLAYDNIPEPRKSGCNIMSRSLGRDAIIHTKFIQDVRSAITLISTEGQTQDAPGHDIIYGEGGGSESILAKAKFSISSPREMS